MEEFLRSSVEWQKWGMNIATISAIGATILTLFQGWSYLKQSQAIWRARSGESVSVIMFSYFLFYFMAFAVYALSAKSVVMMLNALLFLFILPVVAGLIKFKSHFAWEKLSYVLFGIMPLCMVMTSEKKLLFLLLLFGVLAATTLPIFEILRNRERGVIDVRFIIVGLATNVFWFTYALTGANDVPLLIANPIAFVIGLITLRLWIKYPNPPEKRLIEVYYSGVGQVGGRRGRICARFADNVSIHAAAETHAEALEKLLVSLHNHGFSGRQEDYDVQYGEIVNETFVAGTR